ncbi:MAG: DUF11 domain-containing protein [Deltaproteobacteria bacterium]|nr:DUF11 domain-containing protein [Deltaproteobacteria bacterium]
MFDLNAGHKYRLVITPPSASWIFPSSKIPVSQGFATDLLEGGKVVASDLPQPNGDTRYFLRFDIGEEVYNNHIPLDRLDGALRLGKHANKRVASVGDIVTYTITLQNGSGQDLDSNWTTNGIWIRDYTPAGFVYLKDSARIDVVAADGTVQTYGQNNTPQGEQTRGRQLSFGPYPLKSSETLKVRYHMAL